jgi:hypothetical protein
VIIFSLVRFLSKKIIKPVFKKNNQTGSNRLVSVRFYYLKKQVQTGLAWFFSGLARFFSV